jgi:catechol 2,3-dioxygenase-like lactoylglutathione lyase family enzyme
MQALIESFVRTEERMRTYLQSKAMAKSLRESLAALSIELTHSQCLEIVAQQFGFRDWNILAGKISLETTPVEAGTGPVSLEPPIPVLRITSLEVAREFYVDFLGFRFDWGNDEPQAARAYAQVSRDGVQLHLAESGEGGRPGALLFRDMTGLSALHRELTVRQGKYAPTEIRFTPWDSREFEVIDPFGNQLRFWENNPAGVAR